MQILLTISIAVNIYLFLCSRGDKKVKDAMQNVIDKQNNLIKHQKEGNKITDKIIATQKELIARLEEYSQ